MESQHESREASLGKAEKYMEVEGREKQKTQDKSIKNPNT
jgi:hypothetical protein